MSFASIPLSFLSALSLFSLISTLSMAYDSNSMAYDSKQSPATAAKLKSQLPPRSPSSNPLIRKLIMETVPENSVPGASDSGVQVFLFINPRFWLVR
jgi:hypothetical protein